jgi:hypothetical protein
MFFAVENLKRFLTDSEFRVLKRSRSNGSIGNRCSDGADKMFRFCRSKAGGVGGHPLDTTCGDVLGEDKNIQRICYVMKYWNFQEEDWNDQLGRLW